MPKNSNIILKFCHSQMKLFACCIQCFTESMKCFQQSPTEHVHCTKKMVFFLQISSVFGVPTTHVFSTFRIPVQSYLIRKLFCFSRNMFFFCHFRSLGVPIAREDSKTAERGVRQSCVHSDERWRTSCRLHGVQ